MINDLQPQWIMGSPPCTAFCIWNYGYNYKHMKKSDVDAKLEEGRRHLSFCAYLYRKQLAKGRYFLHEHPANASSWKEPCIVQLIADLDLHLTTSPMCAYGMIIRDSEGDPLGLARKNTTWLSNGEAIVRKLEATCSGWICSMDVPVKLKFILLHSVVPLWPA